VRCILALLVLVSGVAACGGSRTAAPSGGGTVTGVVDLERPASGPPDAGTRAGHGADLALATATGASIILRGSVKPADSDVAVVTVRTGRRKRARVAPDGRFTVRVGGLRRGLNRLVLEGRKPGYAPWELDVRVTRR
jgi:hypothetical protein